MRQIVFVVDHEDLKKFITKCKSIPANSRNQIAAQFRLEPARWWSYETPYAPSLHDLEQALIKRYEDFEILTKLRMKFYGITQAVGEPANAFIAKKKTARTAHHEGRIQRVLPNVVERRPPSPRRTTSCRK
jgi:hypothetical protein